MNLKLNKMKNVTLNKNNGINSILTDDDVLLTEFTTHFCSDSVDDLVINNEGFQTLWTVSLNGINPDFEEYIVLPSYKEASKLQDLLAKLTPIKENEIKDEKPINTVDNVSLEISFGLESKDKKKIDECINFSFIDGNGNDIFTSLTKEQLLYKITKDIDNN